ncbi:MAG: hypothetical protein PHF51_00210 [Candidatus ainarchaeum sp.]|nr:hypothetical protein [Candidatus ainarchaeum sp.]
MPKIQRGKDVHFLVLPAGIMKLKGWKKGDELAVLTDQRTGDVYLRKIEPR